MEERTSLTFLRGGLYITLLEYVCLSICSTCCREKKRPGQDWPLTLLCYLFFDCFLDLATRDQEAVLMHSAQMFVKGTSCTNSQ